MTIVEKEPQLGGHATSWRRQLPTQEPYDNLIAPVVESKIKELDNYSNITVKTETVEKGPWQIDVR